MTRRHGSRGAAAAVAVTAVVVVAAAGVAVCGASTGSSGSTTSSSMAAVVPSSQGWHSGCWTSSAVRQGQRLRLRRPCGILLVFLLESKKGGLVSSSEVSQQRRRRRVRNPHQPNLSLLLFLRGGGTENNQHFNQQQLQQQQQQLLSNTEISIDEKKRVDDDDDDMDTDTTFRVDQDDNEEEERDPTHPDGPDSYNNTGETKDDDTSSISDPPIEELSAASLEFQQQQRYQPADAKIATPPTEMTATKHPNTNTESQQQQQRSPPPPARVYRFLLRHGPWGHVVAVSLVLVAEWMLWYIPMVAHVCVAVWMRVGGLLGHRPSSDAQRHPQSRQTPHQKQALDRDSTRRADQLAYQQLQRLYQNTNRLAAVQYRHVSLDFIRRHALKGSRPSSSATTSHSKTPSPDSQTAAKPNNHRRTQKDGAEKYTEINMDNKIGEEEEEDVEWIVQALSAVHRPRRLENSSPPSSTLTSSSASAVSSIVQAVLSQARREKKQQQRGISNSSDGTASSSGGNNNNSGGGSFLERQIRAVAGADSLRNLLGAYPGDAVPPNQAASPRGVLALAQKYGWGSWTREEDEDDNSDDNDEDNWDFDKLDNDNNGDNFYTDSYKTIDEVDFKRQRKRQTPRSKTPVSHSNVNSATVSSTPRRRSRSQKISLGIEVHAKDRHRASARDPVVSPRQNQSVTSLSSTGTVSPSSIVFQQAVQSRSELALESKLTTSRRRNPPLSHSALLKKRANSSSSSSTIANVNHDDVSAKMSTRMVRPAMDLLRERRQQLVHQQTKSKAEDE